MIKSIQAERLFKKGQKQANVGHYEDSVNLFNQALNLFSDDPGIYLHKALSLAEQKKYTEAIELLEIAILKNPSNPAYHLHIGVIYYDNHKINHALNSFEEVLKISPDNLLALCYKHLCVLCADKNADESYAIIRKNIKNTNPGFKSRLLSFCESFILQFKDDAYYLNESLFYDTYITCRHKKNDSKGKRYDRFHLKLNRFYVKIRYFPSRNKMKAFHHFFAGTMKLKRKNFIGAENEFKEALNHLPTFEEIQYLLIDLYFYQKDYKAAYDFMGNIEGFKNIVNISNSGIKIDSKKDKLANHLQMILTVAYYDFNIGEYGKAVDLFQLITEHSKSYQYTYYLGICFLALGKNEKSEKYFKKSVEKINPDLPKMRLDEMRRLVEKKVTKI